MKCRINYILFNNNNNNNNSKYIIYICTYRPLGPKEIDGLLVPPGVLIVGKSLIKWRQRPDMAIAVDWDLKNQFKQKSLLQNI